MAIDAKSLGYLLPSDTQLLSYNGKPITGGHVEVYEAGTDNKYITYQSFDGVENPFSVIIPSDGRVVLLVELGKKYDYYVYDSYRNPVFSRQNVLPVGDYEKHLYGEGDIYVTNGETSSIIFADFSKYAEKKDIVDYYGGQNIKIENDGKISLTNKTSLFVEAPISYRKETGKVILTTQTMPVNKGGTGATTPSAAANNLGVYTKNETDTNGRTVHHYNPNWQVGKPSYPLQRGMPPLSRINCSPIWSKYAVVTPGRISASKPLAFNLSANSSAPAYSLDAPHQIP